MKLRAVIAVDVRYFGDKMIGLKRLIDKIGESKKKKDDGSTGLLMASGIDMFIDGLLVGVSFSVGVKQGVMITIALTIELLLLGLSVASSLIGRGVSRKRVITTTAKTDPDQ